MDEVKKQKFTELTEAAAPLIDFLYKYYDPHTTIIINQFSTEVLCGDMAFENELRD